MRLHRGPYGFLAIGVFLIPMFLLAPRSEAQLGWGTRRIEVRASLQDTNAVAVFAFTNTTTHAIAIHEVRSSCGACTAAELPKKQYMPGETGCIRVTYSFGNRVGQQDSTIIVRMDDLVESTVVLSLRVYIPEIFEMRPAFVFWRIGEEPVPKEVSLKVVYEKPIHLLGVKAEGEVFQAKIRTLEEGREYVLTITPKDTKAAARARILLETDFAMGAKKEFTIPAMIREEWSSRSP
ncbi:MAG: DUF1573 domain-containing protein [Verrucomicrobiae bacterium]|nr:DUF1573 domain-containing protein [Verrucomicrobiae bacterium]